MSFIGDVFDGSKGTGWQAKSADLDKTVNASDIQGAKDIGYSGLNKYDDFLNQVNAQGGLANQTAAYNQAAALARGEGPDPAKAMLDQATSQNVANQTAMMASARGVNANPALMARQAANTGAGIQQQSAGQAATMQANQQLGAMSDAANIANQQAGMAANAAGNRANVAQNLSSGILNAANSQNNTNVSNVGQQNASQAQLATAMAQGQQAITGGLIKSVSSMPQMKAKGGVITPTFHYADGSFDVGSLLGDAGGSAPNSSSMSGTPAASSSAATPGAATPEEGGFSFDGPSAQANSSNMPDFSHMANSSTQMPDQKFADYMEKPNNTGNTGDGKVAADPKKEAAPAPAAPQPRVASGNPGADALFDAFDMTNRTKGMSSMAMLALAKGGGVPETDVGSKLKGGGKVPGKAKVKGNSYANDTVNAKLSPGEIVLPRSITQSSDPVGNAAKFVAAHLAQRGGMPRKGK